MKHKIATGDFETRSELEINAVGVYRYCEHESTEALDFSYNLQDGKGLRTWIIKGPGATPPPKDLTDYIASGGILEAHNAEFEWEVWNTVLPRQLKIPLPKLLLGQIRCSAAEAAALALPRSLENLGKGINATKQKDMEGKKIMLRMAKPRPQWLKDRTGPKWFEEPEDFKALHAYNRDDVLAEESAGSVLIPLSNYEQKVFEYTVTLNKRGVYTDRELCRNAVRFASIYSRGKLKGLHALTGGTIQTAGQNAKIKAFLESEGCTLPNLQAQTVVDALERDDLSMRAREMLEIKRALGKSSLSKFATLLNSVMNDGRLRGLLMYHGASTGRFTGKIFQPHNLPKGSVKDLDNLFAALKENDYKWFETLYPNVFDALSSAVRGMLKAAPDHKFIFADFAQIEARVLMWLTGCELGVELFKGEGRIYEEMAMDIFKMKTIDKMIHAFERTVGKHCVLGAGFQMGWKRFIDTCKKFGVKGVTPQMAKDAIAAYRIKFAEVKKGWSIIEDAALEAVQTGKCIKIFDGKIQFLCKRGFLWVRLPSGRKLAYYKPQARLKKKRVEFEKNGKVVSQVMEKMTVSYLAVHPKTKQLYREDSYGGKWMENVVQAIARDLMVAAMFRLEEAGYPIIMNVHDEIGAEVKKTFGSVEEFEKLMAIVPKWGEGIPVKAEGWEGPRFKK